MHLIISSALSLSSAVSLEINATTRFYFLAVRKISTNHVYFRKTCLWLNIYLQSLQQEEIKEPKAKKNRVHLQTGTVARNKRRRWWVVIIEWEVRNYWVWWRRALIVPIVCRGIKCTANSWWRRRWVNERRLWWRRRRIVIGSWTWRNWRWRAVRDNSRWGRRRRRRRWKGLTWVITCRAHCAWYLIFGHSCKCWCA